MDNFLGGFHAVMLGLADALSQVTNYPLFWGFATGFLTSTIAHLFLLSEHPRDVPTVLFQEKAKSFAKLYAPKKGGAYTKSYTEYSRTAHQIKLLALISVMIISSILLSILLINLL